MRTLVKTLMMILIVLTLSAGCAVVPLAPYYGHGPHHGHHYHGHYGYGR